MLLVIDVGNTNIVLGVFKGKELLDHWRISTNKLRTTDEYGVLIRDLFYLNDVNSEDIDSIIISSVVPPVMPTLERMCQRYFGLVPLIIGPGVKTGMDIKYDNPREVGADRIVNAVAAYAKYGGPVIIIDFGTATTFCAVDKKGNYLGGYAEAVMPVTLNRRTHALGLTLEAPETNASPALTALFCSGGMRSLPLQK